MGRKQLLSYRQFITAICILIAFGWILLLTDIYEFTAISSMATTVSTLDRIAMDTIKPIYKQCLHESFYDINHVPVTNIIAGNRENHINILIIGITTCNGYYLSKYFINNAIFDSFQMIGMDDFIKKSSQFNSQISREQELIRMGINIIREDICNKHLLSEIIKSNKISLIINASDRCQRIISNLNKTNSSLSLLNSEMIIDIQHHLPSDYLISIPVPKKYLLISTFYIAQKDPLHSNIVHYTFDAEWCIEYMFNWYTTFKKAANISDLRVSPYDIVVIHDGLLPQVFQNYSDVIFVNMGQYPMEKIRRSANDIRYYDMLKYLKKSKSMNYQLILTTDVRDVDFGDICPFQYLLSKNILNGIDIFVGAEDDKKDDHKAFKRWKYYVIGRVKQCFGTNSNVTRWTMGCFTNDHIIPTNPGIIAANKHLMIELMEFMVQYFSTTILWNENCNFSVFFIALMDLCVDKQKCNIINDKTFHSPFRKFLMKYIKDLPRRHIIYHK